MTGHAARRGRSAVTAVFALNGFLAAMWVAHIPVITDRTGVDHSALGGLLLLLGGSAFVGMQICGPLIDRWGSRPSTIAAAVALSAAVLTPVLATNALQLALGLIAFGFANGCLDVSMNAQAVQVERAYRRPIMAAFHGFFSIGSLIGSGVVAATLWADVGVIATVAVAGVVGLGVIAASAAGLVPKGYPAVGVADSAVPAGAAPATDLRSDADAPDGGDAVSSAEPWWRGVDLRRIGLMAAVAFALMLAEGTAYDWSALHVVETFGTRDALGAIAFGAFSAAMTVARFGTDRIAGAVGPVAVVRYGALIGIVGMTVAVISPNPGLAIVGWTVFGIGLAGLIPQIFTAAGNVTTESSGRTISLVVGCGYLGMLAGPAIVGFISNLTSLATALCAAILALVFAAFAAGVVRPPEENGYTPDRTGRRPGRGLSTGSRRRS
ncbi:MFS transporter [Gordonia soli]|uniref:Putative major facilitator superfamily transporter n=1 Tax=Gordonia soli NBRC 108243 TaxID=1223545 RepID=M0QKQ6_9ACTN|nr:MFS transporter [Gordonia soli]GAC69143.1 putative major facilitator superfamily transporter [Gordonia soli NBRC 108243]